MDIKIDGSASELNLDSLELSMTCPNCHKETKVKFGKNICTNCQSVLNIQPN